MFVPITASPVWPDTKKLLKTYLEGAMHGKNGLKRKMSKSNPTGWATTCYCQAPGSVPRVRWTTEPPQPMGQPVFTHLRWPPHHRTRRPTHEPTVTKFLSRSGDPAILLFLCPSFRNKSITTGYSIENIFPSRLRGRLYNHSRSHAVPVPTTHPLLAELSPSRGRLIREASPSLF